MMNDNKSDYILFISPNLALGRRRGLTDEQTIEAAEEVFAEMRRVYEESLGVDVEYEEVMTSYGSEYLKPICPRCSHRHITTKQRFCDSCGCKLIWEKK